MPPAQANSPKIAWEDFEPLVSAQVPNRLRALAPKTPISFVVDTKCAAAKLRTLKPGGLLNSVLMNGARAAQHSDEHSVGIELSSAVDYDLVEREVSDENCIKAAGYDGAIDLTQLRMASDPLRARQTHLNYIQFTEGVRLIESILMVRKPVVLAVIDAGVDLGHPDLFVGLWRNLREVPGNSRDDDRNGFVDDVYGYNFGSNNGDPRPQLEGLEGAHGTHVAGLAAARWKNGVGGVGVGGLAQIMSINVFGTKKSTRSSVVENAIRYAARNGADVINLSLSGGEYSRTMSSALRYAVAQGAFIVSASGNEGLKFETSPNLGIFFSPAAYGMSISGMVSVNSVDVESGSLSRFSNFNNTIIQLAAPGANSSWGEPQGIISTFPGGKYGSLAGTSMSAPLVSGAAALVVGYLKACGQSAAPSRVESILVSGSRINPKLRPYVNGGRELNILALAQRLRSLGCR
jgi:hypothetical protein